MSTAVQTLHGLSLVLVELAGRRPVWKQALEGWNVQQSIQVLEWQAEGEKKGRKKGKAESILRILQRRFSAEIPVDLKTAILGAQDETLLDTWLDLTATVNSLEDFRRTAKL